MTTAQEHFWKTEFGDSYSERNSFTNDEFDAFYRDRYGSTRRAMNADFLAGLSINSILEVGCNVGIQLSLLQAAGFKNLHGIEINPGAVQEARARLPQATIVEGSAFALPFPDKAFDLVFTSGVLIHIHPDDVVEAMREIHRVSKHYIWGFEYYSETMQPITYRGNSDRLWKDDFAQKYLALFPDLTLLKKRIYPYHTETGNSDSMFLLEKTAA